MTCDTLWPASPLSTDALFLCIVLTAVGKNCPTESGPNKTGSFARTCPAVITPLCLVRQSCEPRTTHLTTTVPTNGTEKTSLIANSNGASTTYLPSS